MPHPRMSALAEIGGAPAWARRKIHALNLNLRSASWQRDKSHKKLPNSRTKLLNFTALCSAAG